MLYIPGTAPGTMFPSQTGSWSPERRARVTNKRERPHLVCVNLEINRLKVWPVFEHIRLVLRILACRSLLFNVPLDGEGEISVFFFPFCVNQKTQELSLVFFPSMAKSYDQSAFTMVVLFLCKYSNQ